MRQNVQAATYYVSPTGKAPWSGTGNCTDMATPCSLAMANTNAAQGDVINLRGGTYSLVGALAKGINPSNSGTASNKITFQRYSGDFDKPTIEGDFATVQYGLYINDKNYIVIDGIKFKDEKSPGSITGGSFNEVKNCEFYHQGETSVTNYAWIGFFIGYSGSLSSTNNWIHDNSIHTIGKSGDEGGDGLDIGSTSIADHANNNNTIENNLIYYSGHTLSDDYGMYNVWRNNVGHNEGWKTFSGLYGTATGGSATSLIDTSTNFVTAGAAVGYKIHAYNSLLNTWGTGTITSITTTENANDTLNYTVVGTLIFSYGVNYVISSTMPSISFYAPDPPGTYPGNGKYGHRGFGFTGYDAGVIARHILFEGNRSGYGSTNPNNAGSEGLTDGSPGAIVRYNSFFGCDGPGIDLKSYGDDSHSGAYNAIYNNTIYKNGRTIVGGDNPPAQGVGIFQYASAGRSIGNLIKNNIIFGNSNPYSYQKNNYGNVYAGTREDQIWAGNLCDITDAAMGCISVTDPLFTDTTLNDFSNTATKPDFSLQSSSPAINAGTYLTTAVGPGSLSKSLTVSEANYFQAGSAATTTPIGSALSNIAGDYIAVETVSNIVQITDINYSTNVLTLASPISWSDGAPIWLYKKSDGIRVLYGSAPDIGAYEYNSSVTDTTPPAAPTGLSVN